MNTQTTPKFRESSVTAVTRDAAGITVWFREVRKRADGEGVETVRVLDPITLAYSDCSEAVRAEALGYGFEVRLTRQAAMERDPRTHKPVSVEVKAAAVRELRDHYASGTDSWTLAAGGGGGGGLSAETKALIQAVQRVYGLEADVAEEAVRAMSGPERDALRVDAEIKAVLDTIYAQRAGAADAGALKAKLAGLVK